MKTGAGIALREADGGHDHIYTIGPSLRRERPELYRFLDAGDTETFRMRSRPASKKRRGTKSREVGRRRSSGCYEVLDLGRSKSGGVETRGPVKRCGAIFAT